MFQDELTGSKRALHKLTLAKDCSIPNIVKTNNKKSKPACRGKALYKGRVYDVIIKNGKVVACSELSKKIKGKLPTSEFKIVGYDFSIENRSFVNGMGKIAFNFALDQGISLEMINSDVEIDKDDNGKIENMRMFLQWNRSCLQEAAGRIRLAEQRLA